MQFKANKLKEYIGLLDTIGKEYDFELESASFFQIQHIKPEIFIKKDIDELDALTIINALLDHEIMPDYYYDYTNKSLIELAIINKCSIDFVKELISISSKHELDVVGIASNSLKLMIDRDFYSYNDLMEIIRTFFEYGYNYLNECEKNDINILEYFKKSSKYSFKNYKKLVDFGKKGYKELDDNDLLFMYKNIEVNPKNIVKYLFSHIKDYDNRNIDLICNFFKFNLDKSVKMISYISEIDFEIDKNSKSYNGLKIVLNILLNKSEFINSEFLYNLFCSLIVQNDINLLFNVLYKITNNSDFDINYYGENILNILSSKLNEFDMKKLKDKLIEYGYKEDNKNYENNNLEEKINNNVEGNKNIEEKTNNIKEEFKNLGTILNLKDYVSMPGVGREAELDSVYLGLARRNGSVILVGESGVGKTEIANRLAWQIQNNNCPLFLKDRLIVEIAFNNLIAGCIYRGSFEEKMQTFFKKTKKYHAIVVVNEIHNIFGLGSSEGNKFDLAEMLKTEIEEGNIQIIGTTTKEEYDKYFASSALKRRFKKVEIEELSEGLLVGAFEKVINDLCNVYNVLIDENIDIIKLVDIIIRNTKYKHRKYNDRENNPSLGISIIEDAFAYAIVNNQRTITIDDFISAFKSQDRLYDYAKEMAINELYSLRIEKRRIRTKADIIDISYLRSNN